MRCFVCFATAVFLVICLASDSKDMVLPVPQSEMAKFEARTGGMIKQEPNGKAILVVDARGDTSMPLDQLVNVASVMIKLPFNLKTATIGDLPIYDTAKGFKGSSSPSVILFVDKSGWPSLTVFPEDAIAVVNIDKLKTSDVSFYKKRIAREFWRAVGFACGGYAMGGKGDVMQPIFSVYELDSMLGNQLNPMRFNGIFSAALKLDLRLDRPVPYSAAVRQGWAPQPTNEMQRAIWLKYKDRPIK